MPRTENRTSSSEAVCFWFLEPQRACSLEDLLSWNVETPTSPALVGNKAWMLLCWVKRVVVCRRHILTNQGTGEGKYHVLCVSIPLSLFPVVCSLTFARHRRSIEDNEGLCLTCHRLPTLCLNSFPKYAPLDDVTHTLLLVVSAQKTDSRFLVERFFAAAHPT